MATQTQAFGIRAISPAAGANKPHIFGFANPRTLAGDLLLAVWNGGSDTARRFSIDKDGNVEATGGATLGGDITLDGGKLMLASGLNAPSASPGDLVLPNNKSIRAENAAGTDALALIGMDASHTVRIGANSTSAIAFGNPATFAGAGAGDLIIASGKALRWEVGGTTTEALKGTTIGGQPALQLASGFPLAIGAPAVVAGAAAGDVILANGKTIYSALSNGSAIHRLIAMDASNRVLVGGPSVPLALAGSPTVGAAGVVTIGSPASVSGAAAGDLVLEFGKALRSANAAGSATVSLLRLANAGGDFVQVGVASIVGIGTPATVNGATAGDLVLANNRSIRFASVFGTNTVSALSLDDANQLRLGLNNNALVLDNAASGLTATAGSASALPSLPAGYLRVQINGQLRVIPHYNP